MYGFYLQETRSRLRPFTFSEKKYCRSLIFIPEAFILV